MLTVAGAILLLSLYLLLPRELLTESTYGTVLVLLVGGLNVLVFLGATRPLWRGIRPTARQDMARGVVLVPCLLFHLLTPPFGLLWLVAQGLD
ncbi:hypothetical protein CDA63_06770 [Hymenobacter amundsenii]|uniref:Uncharacterized protein n=1 Tax=Hymenobacter amundsenii TaxID=2006685 RepID=A0A246FMJ2_9BACT|nr:hypothetical protein CDA63_06770 [Hymenobacter amundsenii]